ncbi:MAG: FkbM family methyltransferase [Burkholderiales bacterium]|nr:FkbM family methyltransferase [Burkholderiales bacterium]
MFRAAAPRFRPGSGRSCRFACRLDGIGAEFEFLENEKRIRLDGLTFCSPLWTRNEADYLREVLIEDVYGAKSGRWDGAVVVDVGAYIGDTAVAFARAGATVHAIEPSQVFCAFLRKNALANGVGERVIVHPVGLGEGERSESTEHDTLRFVAGVDYTLRHLPRNVRLLKLDCEGAEYRLLSDARFLAHLAPREIRMEYHRGAAALLPLLRAAGYEVDAQSEAQVGYLTAQRRV